MNEKELIKAISEELQQSVSQNKIRIILNAADVVNTIDVSICDEYLSSENEHFKAIQESGL